MKNSIFFACFLAVMALVAASPAADAQLPPVQSPPGWEKVPQGTGACSVEKSCADLAPGMIRSAMGPSPLEDEIRSLAGIYKAPSGNSSAKTQAAGRIVQAFRGAGADEVRIEKFGPSGQFENVVAEIRGRDKPQDYVLVTVAITNGRANSIASAENAAVLIDAVRVIHRTGNIPRRSIRFVLFSGGKQHAGKTRAGSWAYVRAHRADLDRIAAAVAFGAPSGRIDGFALEARPDTVAAVRQALEPLRPLDVRDFTLDVKIPTGVTPLWLQGVPTLIATANRAAASKRVPALSGSSTKSGGVSPAKLRELKRRVAVAAVAAYALADAETRIGPRQSRAEVEQSVRSLRLEPTLRRAGLWRQWQAEKTPSLR